MPLVLASILTPAIGIEPARAGDGWDLLGAIEIRETEHNGRWAVEKTFPEALRAAKDGFRITGYYVPVQAQAYVRSFLLVPDPADCPFCGGGGYGPTLEVQMRKAMPDIAEGTQITVEGTLRLIDSDETYQSAILTEGVLLD
ncbi:hypothetical protein P1J78_00770 [Psychromarinibacter sp. C21-152]|uniref:DUF3299 domain-containing protein n=1 Tax=Psychromarinibacter sediminicola TaxID=3033385 RepID=A0AAE3NNP9_9RHOB|nr:hypothetical protein [Psychromarinibacter sediminicola]MDF0599251.1 hypothetical protein [Psychromarinibacter sediminicola]